MLTAAPGPRPPIIPFYSWVKLRLRATVTYLRSVRRLDPVSNLAQEVLSLMDEGPSDQVNLRIQIPEGEQKAQEIGSWAAWVPALASLIPDPSDMGSDRRP